MAVPKWKYRFTRPASRERIDVAGMLREFHRAMLLGMQVDSLEINGRAVDAKHLMLLNVWIESWGAWRASRMDYFEAWRRLDTILCDQGSVPILLRPRLRRSAARQGP